MRTQNGWQFIRRESISSPEDLQQEFSKHSSMNQSQDDQSTQLQSPEREFQSHLFPNFRKGQQPNRALIKSVLQKKRVSPFLNIKSNIEYTKQNLQQQNQNSEIANGQRESVSKRSNGLQKIETNIKDNEFNQFIEIKQIAPIKNEMKNYRQNKSLNDNNQNYNRYQNNYNLFNKKYRSDQKRKLSTLNSVDNQLSSNLDQIHKLSSDILIPTEIYINKDSFQNDETQTLTQNIQNDDYNNPITENSKQRSSLQKIFNLNFDILSYSQDKSQISRRKSSYYKLLQNEHSETYQMNEIKGEYSSQAIQLSDENSQQENKKQISSIAQINEVFPISNSAVKDQILGSSSQENSIFLADIQKKDSNELDDFDGIQYYKERINRDANNKNKKIILSRIKMRGKSSQRYINDQGNEISEEKRQSLSQNKSHNSNKTPKNFQSQLINEQYQVQYNRRRRIESIIKRNLQMQDTNENSQSKINPYHKLNNYLENNSEQLDQNQQCDINKQSNFEKLNVEKRKGNYSNPNQFPKFELDDENDDHYYLESSLSIQQNNNNSCRSSIQPPTRKMIFYSPPKKHNSVSEESNKKQQLKWEDFIQISQMSPYSSNRDSQKLNKLKISQKPQISQDQNYYDYNVNVSYSSYPTTINFYDNLSTQNSKKQKIKNIYDKMSITTMNTKHSTPPNQKINPPPSFVILKDFVQQRQKPDKILNQAIKTQTQLNIKSQK